MEIIRMKMNLLIFVFIFKMVDGFGESEFLNLERYSGRYKPSAANPLTVDLTLIYGADMKGAVCLDGSLPAYYLHRGYDSGADNWIIDLEGGGWCSNVRECVYRKNSKHGSSNYMLKQLNFTGILSNNKEENPCADFYNWNRVRLNYCDGASFAGEGEDAVHGLQFRGQRIWLAAMEELLMKGMSNVKQALLTGCSAGGLAAILHCDEFSRLFPNATKVKCLSDAGMFLDAKDVAGEKTLRKIYENVVTFQGVAKNLPSTCTDHLDPTSCFFPENLVGNVKTPMFLLNAAYDAWQVKVSLAPKSADPRGEWTGCKSNHSNCTASQIKFFQGFRHQMLNAVKGFSCSKQNGVFINSCFSHCQSEQQDTWYSNNSPMIHNKGIAKSVGDWYFDKSGLRRLTVLTLVMRPAIILCKLEILLLSFLVN